MEKTVLKVNSLYKEYGTTTVYQALKGVDFEVEVGEFVGIMGASGSGKTTLLNIMSSIDTPTSGNVEIDGQNISKYNEKQLSKLRGEEIGFIFQDFSLLDNLSVYENIKLPLVLQTTKEKEMEPKVKSVAQKLNIDMLLEKYPNELSGGQKQRVAAARALVNQPSILFGDEPTGALDSKNAKDFLNNLEVINKEDKTTILLVTHDPISASYCEKILLIKDGQIETEILKETKSNEEFYQDILNMLAKFND